MVESSGIIRNNPSTSTTTITTTTTTTTASATAKCGILETRVRGAWYRVTVTLESDYVSVSLDETCDPLDHTTTLNGTLG